MEKSRDYQYKDVLYKGKITYKRGMRNIVVRINPKEKVVKISSPYFASLRAIDEVVFKAFPKLVSSFKEPSKAFMDNKMLYLGEWIDIPMMGEEEKKAYLKEMALPLFKERVRLYEGLMGVNPTYKVRVREMKTRYGVNSKRTYSLTFQTSLIHYPLNVIDSVVVHELAHHFHFDHSKEFYQVVYRYCPTYKQDHAYLRKNKYDD